MNNLSKKLKIMLKRIEIPSIEISVFMASVIITCKSEKSAIKWMELLYTFCNKKTIKMKKTRLTCFIR